MSYDLTPWSGKYVIGARVYVRGIGGLDGTIIALVDPPYPSFAWYTLVMWDSGYEGLISTINRGHPLWNII